MTLRTIISKWKFQRDILLARIHGRIVGASEDGFGDECMPDWVWNHRHAKVRAAWWGGFAAEGEKFCRRRGLL